jgi:hypothetical protein
VVHQLFSDVNRLLRAIAFGADGTYESGDSLAAATLLENRRLRAEVQGKERELVRHRSTVQQLSEVGAGIERADCTIRDLKEDQKAAAEKVRNTIRWSGHSLDSVYRMRGNDHSLAHPRRWTRRWRSNTHS